MRNCQADQRPDVRQSSDLLRIVKPFAIFCIFFLFGPLFGVIGLDLMIGRFDNPPEEVKLLHRISSWILVWPAAMLLGGIQGYIGGLYAQKLFEKYGRVTFAEIAKKATFVAVVFSTILVLCVTQSNKNLQEVLYVAGYSFFIHLFSAFSCWMFVFPIRNQEPKPTP